MRLRFRAFRPIGAGRLKIAYVFDTFPSPTETFLAREINALRARGLEIEIWALNAGAGAQQIELPPRALKLLGARNYWRATGEMLAAQMQPRRVGHLHGAWANHVADIARAAAEKSNLPWSFAAHAHDLWVSGGDLKSKLQSAKWATVCTRAGEIELQKWGDNVIYAPHGLPLENYPFADWRAGPMKLLGVGRLIPKKGWPDLIEAARNLGAAEVRIIGDGPLRADLPASALVGALPHAQVIEMMQNWANCLILPSRIDSHGDRDGLANVLLEGAALGLPLVTTTAGGASDLVDEETGWLCEPGDASALAATIARVWENEAQTQWRCRNARARVEREFDVGRNVAVLARAFEKSR